MARISADLRSALTRKMVALTAVILSILGVVLAPSAASAAGAPAPMTHVSPAGPPMQLVGFDAAVARANGYEVVRLPDGSWASVPADRANGARKGTYVPTTGVVKPKKGANTSTGGVSPMDYSEAPGDCGTSWVSLIADGNSKASLGTGFSLTPDAGTVWDLNWNIGIVDNGGSSNQYYSEYDGYNAANTWIGYRRVLYLTRGWAYATVKWYNSYTITTHGWVCWSNGPSTSEYID